jgi:metal-responsive CopG/Arc/MetJ family transcriptional regulator
MATAMVNLAFQGDLLQQIDEFAGIEAKTRAELIVKATKLYIDRQQAWRRIFAAGESAAAAYNLTEEDVDVEIKKYRQAKRGK